MNIDSWLAMLTLLLGAFFFFVGTVGMLRFPDVYTRLHALTKADNVGLGLVVLGLAIEAESWSAVGMLVLIWCLVMLAGTTCCYLVARTALRGGIQAWSNS